MGPRDRRCCTGRPRATSAIDRKSTRLNSSHTVISYAVFGLKKKNGCCEMVRVSRNWTAHMMVNGAVLALVGCCASTKLLISACSPGAGVLAFFFNDTAPTEIYTLSLHDALPISPVGLLQTPPPEATPLDTFACCTGFN